MPSKKRVHLQQFGIIHLPNPDLTYIRNLERKIIVMPFHLLKNLRLESFSILYFFFHPPETLMATTIRAHICAWRDEFCQIFIFVKLVYQIVGGQFFLFLQLDG
jgi:hypothetical protein